MQLQLVFRRFATGDSPAADELFVRSSSDAIARDARRPAAWERGPADFAQAPGRSARWCCRPIRHSTTLAALIVEQRLASRKLLDGLELFAKYAGHMRRKGLTPASLPLEVSLEGVYLAIRNAGVGLTQPEVAGSSLGAGDEWQASSSRPRPPPSIHSQPSCFPKGPNFARSCRFSSNARYFKTMFAADNNGLSICREAARWPRLWLRQPQSLLFPSWSRERGGRR